MNASCRSFKFADPAMSRVYWGCFGLTFLVRGLLLFAHLIFPGAVLNDVSQPIYWQAATGFLEHGFLSINGVPLTHIEPLYPLFLAFCRFVSGDSYVFVLLCQIVLRGIASVFFYKLVLSASGSRRTAWIAVFLFAFYPDDVRRTLKLSVTALLTPLLIGAIYSYVRAFRFMDARHALISGIAFGLVVITRSMTLPFVVFASLSLWIKKNLRSWLLFTVPAALIVSAMMFRNYRVDHSFLPTRVGFDFFSSNCEFTDLVQPKYVMDLLDPYTLGTAKREMTDFDSRSEKEIDDFFMKKAIAYIKENPGLFLKRRLKNMLYFFSPWPVPFYSFADVHIEWGGIPPKIVHHHLDHPWRRPRVLMLHVFSYGFILMTALLGMFLRKKNLFREDVPLIMLLMNFIFINSLFWTDTRLGAPVVFCLMYYSAFGISRIIESFRKQIVTR